MNNADKIASKYRNIWLGDINIDEALTKMRKSGASPVECIIALSKFKNVSLGDAKAIVHDSKAWADVKDNFDNLHAQIDVKLKDSNKTV